MSVTNRLFIGFPQPPMIEGDAERLETDRGKLPQEHRVFAENSSIHSLIKINPPLNRSTAPFQLGVRRKTKVAYLRNDFLEPWRRDDVVVHQREVFLSSIKFFHATHEQRERSHVALIAFQLRHSTKTALPDAASRRISKVSIIDWIRGTAGGSQSDDSSAMGFATRKSCGSDGTRNRRRSRPSHSGRGVGELDA